MRGPDPSLAGKRVWVTRPARQAAGLCGLIAARQGVAVKMPTLAILPARGRVVLAGASTVVAGVRHCRLHQQERRGPCP